MKAPCELHVQRVGTTRAFWYSCRCAGMPNELFRFEQDLSRTTRLGNVDVEVYEHGSRGIFEAPIRRESVKRGKEARVGVATLHDYQRQTGL